MTERPTWRPAASGQARAFFPVAAWYMAGPSRATMVEPLGPGGDELVRRDLTLLKESGLNSVRGWIDWASGEPKPGVYDLSALDRLLRHSGELGLKVILQVYLDCAPDWIGQEFPDSRYVSQGGQAIDSQGSPGYCYDHPGVRHAAERFMRAVAARVRHHPALLAYDVWSEPHVVQWAYFDYLPQPALFCYCHHTQQRFRRWLKARYGELERLNRAWYRRFGSWEAVQAPRFVSLMTYTDFIDWQRFIVDKITQDLAWRARTIKAVDPDHPVGSHSAVPPVMTVPLVEQGEPDDWQVARVLDLWGTSFYPKHVGAALTADPAVRGAYLDSTRSACASAGRPMWLGELQGGHGYVGTFAEPVTADDIRAWAWGPISHGAKGLCFYAWRPMSRGYESAGFGLCHPDGSPSERALAAGEVAKVVDRHAGLFAAAQVTQSDVAILWNNDANILWGCLREKSPDVPAKALLGAYRALFERHFPVDFVHPDQIAALAAGRPDATDPSAGEANRMPCSGPLPGATGPACGNGAVADGIDVRRYKVLYLPFAIMVRRDVAQGLRAFVEAGGTVVAEARTGWNNEEGVVDGAVPGSGLRELFGAQEAWVRRPAAEVAAGAVQAGLAPAGMAEAGAAPVELAIDPDPSVSTFAGGRIRGAYYLQALEVLDARVIGRFAGGHPAVTVRRVGKGRAVLVGSWVSYGYQVYRDPAAGAFLAGFAEAAGARRPVEVEAVEPMRPVTAAGETAAGATVTDGPALRPVEVRLLTGETPEDGPFHLLFAFNHGQEGLVARLRLKLTLPGRRFLLAPLVGPGQLREAEVGPDGWVRYAVGLEPRAIAVVRITPV